MTEQKNTCHCKYCEMVRTADPAIPSDMPIIRRAFQLENVFKAWRNLITSKRTWPVEVIPFIYAMENELDKLAKNSK